MLTRLNRAARCKGVSCSEFVASIFASCATSTSTISSLPDVAAKCIDVIRFLFTLFTLAPFSRHASTISMCPFSTAKCSAVCPSLSSSIIIFDRMCQPPIRSPQRKRSLTTSVCKVKNKFCLQISHFAFLRLIEK